ncbi:hypothetical protein QF037_000871 [Streptomyces canus]|uniref:hypothetical protein n=1 Tax=Streptomyces canus TaxID=58343 RepID=UPI00278598AE|nr:hypothetical protein [Streptomyces canus]MDQ0596526.1 hypothetical protein [Streptomyces canus]
MERVVDLDRAAAEITERRRGWERAGLIVEAVTWRDEAASWPQVLETERGRVQDPDSIGVLISDPNEAELGVVLFRGGWADVDALTLAGDVVAEAPTVDSPMRFGVLRDHCVIRTFGVQAT